MFRSKRARLITAVLLVLILILFFIWYGSLGPRPEKGSYPNQEHLIEDYEAYIGEEVEVGGEVIEADPLKIEAESGDKKIVLEITGLKENEDIDEGDRLTVYGVAREHKTIEAENAVIQPFINWVYMYLVSGIAAVWVFVRIVKQWRWDPETASFKTREKPVRLTDLISRKDKMERGGDHDG